MSQAPALNIKTIQKTLSHCDIKEWYASHLEYIHSLEPSGIWIYLLSKDEILQQIERLPAQERNNLPLYGVPFAIKDNIDYVGLPTTAACKEYEYIAKETSPVVQAFLDAGAILIGKTNLDQFATGLVGVRTPYPIPGNSFNPEYIPGGSSCGSAIAVAKGLVTFSLGTDTAGSGRVPAAFNNLYGYKPSKGLLSTKGVVPACRSLDCVSIFTLVPEDADNLFPIAAQYDKEDPFARPYLAPDKTIQLCSFRFGIPKKEQLKFFGNDSGESLFNQKCEDLIEKGGAKVEIDFSPFLTAAKLLYEGPWVTERYVAIEDFITDQPDALHPITHKIISGGKAPLASDAFKANYKLAALKKLADEVWTEVDFIITPTAGTCYTQKEVEDDPIQSNSNLGYYTNFMNLLDYSAIAIPAGFQNNGIPFGVTLFAPAFYDLQLIKLANHLSDKKFQLGATGQFYENPKTDKPSIPENFMPIVVCGAHMAGLPLNHQLTDRKGIFIQTAKTKPGYRLYKLPGDSPKRPALVADDTSSTQLDVEVWAMPKSQFGSFLDGIPSPLGLGKVKLEDGSILTGFIAEQNAILQAEEITHFGNWRNYINQ